MLARTVTTHQFNLALYVLAIHGQSSRRNNVFDNRFGSDSVDVLWGPEKPQTGSGQIAVRDMQRSQHSFWRMICAQEYRTPIFIASGIITLGSDFFSP